LFFLGDFGIFCSKIILELWIGEIKIHLLFRFIINMEKKSKEKVKLNLPSKKT